MTADRLEAENQANELREEVTSLLEELRSVNAKYEEAVEEREKARGEKEKALEEGRVWKKRYEQTKTELRNIKGERGIVRDAYSDHSSQLSVA